MNNPFILNWLAIPLVMVVISDLFYRKIPNYMIVVLLIMIIGNIGLYFFGLGSYRYLTLLQASVQLGWSAFGALIVLNVGLGLVSIGQMEEGDAKLMAVLCLMIGGDNLVTFLLLTALAGGVMAFFIPVIRFCEARGARLILHVSSAFPLLRIPVPDAAHNKPSCAGMPYALAVTAGMVSSLSISLSH